MVRKSNFELLRIISMMMVVGLHYFNGNMGGALKVLDNSHLNFYVTHFFESFSIVGVNCFILIMGYFNFNKKSVNLIKVVTLLAQVIFYSVVLFIVGLLTGSAQLTLSDSVQALLPFLVGIKWFVETYIIMYLLSPFVNRALEDLDKKQFQTLLIILFILFSVWPSMLPSPPVIDGGYGIINFVFVYTIGAYLRRFYNSKRSGAWYLGGYIVSCLIIFAASLVAQKIGVGIGRVWGYNFVFNIIGSVFLFLAFSKLNIQSKTINFMAKFAFGVYLIHADPSIRRFFYDTILNTSKYWYSEYFVLHMMVTTILTYLFCVLIDIVRLWIFDILSPLTSEFSRKYLPVVFKDLP